MIEPGDITQRIVRSESGIKEQRMLEVSEAAEALGISVATIKRYRKRGLIGGYQYTEGGKWVFPEEEIQRFKAGAFRKGPDVGDG